jgi:hypothetical protein
MESNKWLGESVSSLRPNVWHRRGNCESVRVAPVSASAAAGVRAEWPCILDGCVADEIAGCRPGSLVQDPYCSLSLNGVSYDCDARHRLFHNGAGWRPRGRLHDSVMWWHAALRDVQSDDRLSPCCAEVDCSRQILPRVRTISEESCIYEYLKLLRRCF